MSDLVESPPPEFSWPVVMSPPHPDTVGSYGLEAQRWIEAELGLTLRHWQKVALRRQYEHDADGELCWGTLLESTPRRSGKSIRMYATTMERLANADRFGELQTVVHTGSDMPIFLDVWAMGWRYAAEAGWHVIRTNGKESLTTPDGSRWLVRSQHGVYGYLAGLGLVDEGWNVKPSTVDDGLEPALMERSRPQLWISSTANRRATSMMPRRITAAMDEIRGGVSSDVLLMWWGMAPDSDLDDPDVWRRASPHWSEQRRKMIARKLERAMLGESDPEDDDPDPVAAVVSQYGNSWPSSNGRRPVIGDPVVTAVRWAALLADQTPSGPPAVAAVESWYSEGVSVACAWPVSAERVVVGVVGYPNVPEAARGALEAGAAVVLVGKTLATEPAFTGQRVEPVGARMIETVTDLRRLIDNGVLRHDGSPLLADQVGELRTQRGPDGPRVVSRGRADAVKAAVWAAALARRPRAVAAVF